MPGLSSHPSREELAAYSLGLLPEAKAVAIDTHIGECDPCCETIVEISSADTFADLLEAAGRLPDDSSPQIACRQSSQLNLTVDGIPTALTEHPRYEVHGLIGKGGMGDVYRARHRVMRRTVAIKVIRPELIQKPEAVDRFHREVTTAARLSHPNVVAAHDAENAGDLHYLVMEHVDGVDLAKLVSRRGPLPVTEACEYIRQAASGLQYAYEQGMVHRDIKPHNLMVTADGTIKILDFGLASFGADAAITDEIGETSGELTTADAIMGTPDFIAPEQAEDARKADIRSDVYSLGATLYFLLSGKPPFAGVSVRHKLSNHAHNEPDPLDSLRHDIPVEVLAIVAKMMAKNPKERFQVPEEITEALNTVPTAPSELLDAPPAQPSLQSQPERGRRLPVGLITALLFATFFAGVVYYIVTDEGTVRVEVADESLEVEINRQVITMRDGNREPLEIRAGNNRLIIRQPKTDFEFETDKFQIKRNGELAFKVDLQAGHVVVSRAGEPFDSQALQPPKQQPPKQLPPKVSPTEQVGGATRLDKTLAKPSTNKIDVHSAVATVEQIREYAAKIAAAKDSIQNGAHKEALEFLLSTKIEYRGWEFDYLMLQLTQAGNKYATCSQVCEATESSTLCLAFTHDARILLPTPKGVIAWDYPLNNSPIQMPGAGRRSIAISRQRDLVATAGFDGKIQVWSTSTGEKVLEYTDHNPNNTASGAVETRANIALAFSPNGDKIVSAAYADSPWAKSIRPQLQIWSTATGETIKRLDLSDYKNQYGITSVSWNANGLIATGGVRLHGNADVVRLWDAETGQQFRAVQAHGRDVVATAFSPDGNSLLSADERGTVIRWDATLQQQHFRIQGLGYDVALAWSPDSKRFLTAADDDKSRIRIWDAGTGLEVFSIDNLPTRPTVVAFSPDGKQIAATGLSSPSPFKPTVWSTEGNCFPPVDVERELSSIQQDQRNSALAAFTIQRFRRGLWFFTLSKKTYPDNETGLQALDPEFVPAETGLLDPWGNPYRYRNAGEKFPEFPLVWSHGPDGKPNTDDDIDHDHSVVFIPQLNLDGKHVSLAAPGLVQQGATTVEVAIQNDLYTVDVPDHLQEQLESGSNVWLELSGIARVQPQGVGPMDSSGIIEVDEIQLSVNANNRKPSFRVSSSKPLDSGADRMPDSQTPVSPSPTTTWTEEQISAKYGPPIPLPDGTNFYDVDSGLPADRRSWAEPGDKIVLRVLESNKKKSMRLPDGTPFYGVEGGIPQAHRSWAQIGDTIILQARPKKKQKRKK